MERLQRITPFLWFDNQAEEAAHFYTSIFKDSKIKGLSRYGDSGPGPKGSVMTVVFDLEGQEFVALNGGPVFKFTEAISFAINCDTQAEIDEYWTRLTADGGKESQCGWLKDKYGMSWQVVPRKIGEFLTEKDPAKSERVMKVVMKMKKLDLKAMEDAFNQG